MATISQIKTEISAKTKVPFVALNMVRQMEIDGETKTKWLSHWDNDNRIRIVLHEEVLEAIKANPNKDDLAYKYTLVAAEVTDKLDEAGQPVVRESYRRFTIITPKNIEMVL